jgi:hypothetical protein
VAREEDEMRKRFRAKSTGRGPFIAFVALLAALVAAYGAFVLPRVATTAREAAPADASPAVLVSAGDADGTWTGCPWKSGQDGSQPTIELRAVT